MMPNTEEKRQALIAHCKSVIEAYAPARLEVAIAKIALALLEATPIHKVQLDDAWAYLSEGATARAVYPALPVPALKPIELPRGYKIIKGQHFQQEDTAPVMQLSDSGDWLDRFDVERSLRAAGYEVKS